MLDFLRYTIPTVPCSQLQPQLRGKPCVLHGSQLHTVYIKAPGHPNRTETGSLHVPHTALESLQTREARRGRGLRPPVREGIQGEGSGSSWCSCCWLEFSSVKPVWFVCQTVSEDRLRKSVRLCVLVLVLHVQLPYISLGPRWGVICLQTPTWSSADVPTPDVAIHHLQCQSDFHNPVIYGIFKQPQAKFIPVP